MSAAETVVELVRKRVPGWIEELVEPDLWKFTDQADPDDVIEDYGPNYILVDARERPVFVLPEQFSPKRFGPSLIGWRDGIVTHICFAPMLDRSEVRSGLAALEATGVLPPPA